MCEYWNEAIKKITARNTAEGPQEKKTSNAGQLWPLTFEQPSPLVKPMQRESVICPVGMVWVPRSAFKRPSLTYQLIY